MRGSLEQHELARAVAALRECLGQLTTTQRRVLVLRAGLGPRSALSREQVARRLDLGRAQVQRIEQRGLRRLGALDGAGQCVAGGNEITFAELLGSTAFGGAASTALVALTDAELAQPRSGVKGVSDSGDGSDGGDRSGIALPPPIGDGGEATLLVALGLLLALGLLVRRELLRR